MLRHALLVLLVASGCASTGGEGVEFGFGGKADDLGESTAYRLHLVGDYQRCEMDMTDKDGDGDTEECREDKDEHIEFTGVIASADGTTTFAPCRLTMNANGNELEVSDELIRSHGAVPLFIESDGSRVWSETQALVWGALLDDPLNDTLPTDGDDDRLADHDENDKPGININPPGPGAIHASLRVSFSLDGTGDQSDVGEPAEMRRDMEFYGDSIPFTNVVKKKREGEAKNRNLGQTVTFSLQALEGPTDCDAVLE